MKSILVITPTVDRPEHAPMVEQITRLGTAEVAVRHTFIGSGPASVESFVDEAHCVPALMDCAIAADHQRISGILINCMCDPGLYAVRECVECPVVATAEVAMHTAAILGHRFGFVDVLESSRTLVEDQVQRYGVASRYGGFRAVEIPVLEIDRDQASTVKRLTDAISSLVVESHVDTAILGCGSFIGCAPQLRQALLERQADIPVINPLPLAIGFLIALVEAGLTHSKRAYPTPRSPQPQIVTRRKAPPSV